MQGLTLFVQAIAVGFWLALLSESCAGETPTKAGVRDQKVAWSLTCVDIHKSDSLVQRIVWVSHTSRQDVSIKDIWLAFELLGESNLGGGAHSIGRSSRGGLKGIEVPPGTKALIFDAEMTKYEGSMPGIDEFKINGEPCEISVNYMDISVLPYVYEKPDSSPVGNGK